MTNRDNPYLIVQFADNHYLVMEYLLVGTYACYLMFSIFNMLDFLLFIP